MNRFILFCVCLLSISPWACKNSPTGTIDPMIKELETAFNTTPNDDNYNKLINKYLEIIQGSAKGTDLSEILIKGSLASEKMNKSDQQIIFINNLVKNYPDRQDAKDNIYKIKRQYSEPIMPTQSHKKISLLTDV